MSANSLKLNRGTLTAVVPPNAIGFTVESPTSKTEDLGTEFGVRVNLAGDSDVEVFKGTVQVTAVKATETASEAPTTAPNPAPIRVIAGQLTRVRAGQTAPPIEAGNELGFVRTLQQAQTRQHELAWWRFEAGQPGEQVPAWGDLAGTVAVHDASPNGNELFANVPETVPRFSNDVASEKIPSTGDGNHGSLDTRKGAENPSTPRDLYTRSRQSHPAGVDLEQIEPAQWTIEASVKFAALNTGMQFQTIVARDGVGADVTVTDRLAFLSPAQLQQSFPGALLRYRKALPHGRRAAGDRPGRLLVPSCRDVRRPSTHPLRRRSRRTRIRAGCRGATAQRQPNGPAKSRETYSWVIGRAMYGGNFTDQLNGWVDEVRISDVALKPSQFLFSSEPKSGE